MRNLNFKNQTNLLLDIIGTVISTPDFSLKGGTAINFFYSNMPRLSVDLDLAYTLITPRGDFIRAINTYSENLIANLHKKHGVTTKLSFTSDMIPKQILVFRDQAQVKIDINIIIRGTVYPVIKRSICEKIKNEYGINQEIYTLSFEDLYAGKFCAALDRQHPRDLFDVMSFFRKNIISEKLKKAFIVYLISGNRPISELINPNRLDQTVSFENEFLGMTDEEVSYESLEAARETLIKQINLSLTETDKNFLISFKKGTPKWDLLGITHVQNMPAIQWKLHNIKKMEASKYKKALLELEKKLGAITNF